MALTGGGFGTGDFQAQLQTSPLTADQAKYSTTRHRLGGQAYPKRTRTREQGRELPGAAATRGPCTPAGERGARSDGIPHSHLFGDTAFFTHISRSFPLSPNDLVFCGGGSSAWCRVAAGACSQEGRGLLADTSKDVRRSIP